MNVEQIARICHEVNKAYCASIGDASQPAWDEAPQWQRDSAMASVRQIVDDPTTSPERSHESWMAQKAADGWTYGLVKNADAKEHPCMVPYALLSNDQRTKDHLVGAVVRACLPVLVPA